MPLTTRGLPGSIFAFGCLLSTALGQRIDSPTQARLYMVRHEVMGRGVRDQRVVKAMSEVPRHRFVPADQRKLAYWDAALPIGDGQTITSPFVVAFMTEKLEPQPSDRVLEIGTGSGYQASVLSRIVADVFTIEIVEPLGLRAAKLIEQSGYDNIHTRIGDGYKGWPEHAPFDKIIVTCSPETIPPALVQQLKEGGLLVVPLGERFQQSLFLFRKVDGKLVKRKLEATFFVPMTGQAEQLRLDKDDSGIPEIVNGNFETQGAEGEVSGWFYVRQAKVAADSTSADSRYVLLLQNQTPGQNAHALQPVGLDGRKLNAVIVSARIRTHQITGPSKASLPRIELTFHDERRAPIRTVILSDWIGDQPWTSISQRIPVPGRSRLAVVTVGIFGATGQFAVDDLQIQAVRAKGD